MSAPPANDAGRLAWVTGGGSGIGRALALALSRAGWRVVISGRDADRLADACADDPAGRLTGVTVDVTDVGQVTAAVADIEQQHGPIALAILNAGNYQPMSLKQFDADLFRRLMEVNYLGVVQCFEALLPGMRNRRQGQIMITASLSGYRGLPRAAPYGATKAALINFAESLRNECLEAGIRLRVLNPGFVRSPLTDKNDFHMPFLVEPEAIADYTVARLDGSQFEIAYPRAMHWTLRVLRWLPDRLYFLITRQMAR